jgi:hypothetical protein
MRRSPQGSPVRVRINTTAQPSGNSGLFVVATLSDPENLRANKGTTKVRPDQSEDDFWERSVLHRASTARCVPDSFALVRSESTG